MSLSTLITEKKQDLVNEIESKLYEFIPKYISLTKNGEDNVVTRIVKKNIEEDAKYYQMLTGRQFNYVTTYKDYKNIK
jgi:hypothetical protein